MNKERLALVAIILIAFALRLYRLPEMVGFDFDQEYAAMFAQNILQVYPISLIGQGLSVQGLFMGPLYFYYLVPFFAASSLYPIGGYVGSVILGIVIVLAYYFTLNDVFGKRAGLIAAFLRAVLFFKIQADWTMTPAYSSELAILATFYCFYKYWHGRHIFLLPLGFIFGLYTSFHPILFSFYLLFLALILIKRKLPHIKYIFLSFVLFLIPLLPLIIFEYLRNFLEVRLLFTLDSSNKAEAKTLETLKEYVNLLLQYPANLFFPQLKGVIVYALSIPLFGLITFGAIKKVGFWNDKFHLFAFFGTIISVVLYYFFLPTHATDYYFLGAEVIILVYLVATFSLFTTRKKYLFFIGVFLSIIGLFNIWAMSDLWRNPPARSLAHKEAVVKEIAKRQKDNKMSISYDIEYGQHFGLGYLARKYNLIPEGGVNVPEYIIVIPKEHAQENVAYSSGDIGLIIREKK